MSAAKLRRKSEEDEAYPDNLSLDTASNTFIWRERIRGVNYWRSTGTDKLGLARAKVKLFRSEATGIPVERLRHKVSEAFDIVLTIQDSKSKKTGEMAHTQDKHLRPWFDQNCEYLSELERRFEEVWGQYKTDQAVLTPGRKLTHDRRQLLMALKRAKDKGWVTREFKKKDFQLLEATEPVGRIIEQAELDYLLPAVKKHETLYPQVLMGLLMGMRLREILHLQWSEVDLKKGLISIQGQRVKTRTARVVPIHSLVKDLLQVRRQNSKSPYVFPARHTDIEGRPYDYGAPQDSNAKAWGRALLAAARAKALADRPEIDPDELERTPPLDCRFHDLRHTAISFMVTEGIPDLLVSKITGASLKVIQRVYLHMNLDVTEKVRNLRCGKIVGILTETLECEK